MSSSSSFSLVARDLARVRGGSTVLDGVDVSVGPRTRLGVVGPNGVGKTTLLRLLAGLDRPDRGSVTRTPPNARVGYLPQEPERSPRESLLDFLARRTGVQAADAELERTAAALATSAADADDAYTRAHSTTTSRPAARTSKRAPASRVPIWDFRNRCCTRRRRHCRAGRRRARRSRRSSSAGSTCISSTSRPTISTSPGSRASSDSSTSSRAVSSW